MDELKLALWNATDRAGKYDPVRQRLTLPVVPGEKSGKALEKGKTLAFYGLKDGSTIQHKDLGIQVCSIGSCVESRSITDSCSMRFECDCCSSRINFFHC